MGIRQSHLRVARTDPRRVCTLVVAVLAVSALVAGLVTGAHADTSVQMQANGTTTVGDATTTAEVDGAERTTTEAADGGEDADFEPNDGIENATNVTNGTYTGLSIDEDDFDTYAVELAPGETLTAAISFSHAEGDLDMGLVGPDGQETLAISESTTDGENISYEASEAGTHYLVVYGYQNATAPYDLTVSTTRGGPGTDGNVTADAFEPNNGFDSATPINFGSYQNLSVGLFDADFYAVNLSAGESMVTAISFDHTEGDLDMALVGPDGRETLAISQSTTNMENVSYVAPQSGTYYLVVYGYQDATAPYDLIIATSSGPDGNATNRSEARVG